MVISWDQWSSELLRYAPIGLVLGFGMMLAVIITIVTESWAEAAKPPRQAQPIGEGEPHTTNVEPQTNGLSTYPEADQSWLEKVMNGVVTK